MTTESDPAFVSKPAPLGYRYAGPWIRLAALLIDGVLLFLALMALWLVLGLALAVTGYALNPLATEGWPVGAVLASFGSITGNSAIDAGLGVAGIVVFVAIGITISKSPTPQGFHDRLAGGTFVVRPA